MKRRALLLVFLAFTLAACGKRHVVTQPELPPLEPPPPPERVIAPPEGGQGVGGESKPGATGAEPTVARPPRQPKPKPSVAEPPVKPEVAPAPPAEVKQPAPLLTGDAEAQEKEAKELLDQASNNLGKVNQSTLTADAKQQFDTATRFMQQARQALSEKNPSLALRLAKNAATILAALANR